MSIKPHHDALLKIMLVMSTADGERPDKELNMIADLTRNLPVFSSVTADDLILAIRATTVLLEEADSIDDLIEEAAVSLPKPLRETAYALAVEVAAVDLLATEEELSERNTPSFMLEIEQFEALTVILKVVSPF